MNQLSTNEKAGQALRYDNLDGLRSYAAIGIVVMHVLDNGAYGLGGFVFSRFIPSLADLVFLFMVISGFSMCCGYYEKVIGGKLDLGKFYVKRFAKVWPFFALMCLADFIMSPGLDTLYQLLADLTLCFGLIPNAGISVIGVGWFLGLVFVFYFLFPFICSLLSDKRRAWLSFGVAVLLSSLCVLYFDAGRTSFAYSGVFFLAGGMLYIYREPLRGFADRFGWIVALLAVGALVLYYLVGSVMPTQLLVAVLLTLLAMGRKNVILSNPVTKKLSAISMEIYLCHMMVYRVLEKLKLHHIFGANLLSYAVTALLTLALSALLAVAVNKALSALSGIYQKRKTGGKTYVR